MNIYKSDEGKNHDFEEMDQFEINSKHLFMKS